MVVAPQQHFDFHSVRDNLRRLTALGAGLGAESTRSLNERQATARWVARPESSKGVVRAACVGTRKRVPHSTTPFPMVNMYHLSAHEPTFHAIQLR